MTIDMRLVTQARAQTLTNMIELLNNDARTHALHISIIQELNGMDLFEAPPGTVKDGELTLNISMAACPNFTMTTDGMAVAEMRFNGKVQAVFFPATLIRAVTSINHAGEPFFQEAFVPFCENPETASARDNDDEAPDVETPSVAKRPHLRVVH
jgi:stringent starvation protein B